MRALKVTSFKSVSEVVVSMNDLKGKRRAWKLLNFSKFKLSSLLHFSKMGSKLANQSASGELTIL